MHFLQDLGMHPCVDFCKSEVEAGRFKKVSHCFNLPSSIDVLPCVFPQMVALPKFLVMDPSTGDVVRVREGRFTPLLFKPQVI